jgi:dynein heavy chain
MQKSLKEMVKAIKGEILMTPIADEMYNSFLNNMVPQMWKGCSYPSLKSLSTWFDDLIERIAFFENWIQNGKPKAYWISCFFFPQGFLTSVL